MGYEGQKHRGDHSWTGTMNESQGVFAYHDLSKTALLLIKKGKPDVNIVEDEHGNSPIFTAIREYGLTWTLLHSAFREYICIYKYK